MSGHTLEPASDKVIQVFDRDAPPVLTVSPGEAMTVRTLDAYGFLDKPTRSTPYPMQMFTPRLGHCMAGPIEVLGAQPGQMIAVHIEDLTPGTWGWTTALDSCSPLDRRLGFDEVADVRLLWEIDAGAGVAVSDHGFLRPTAPFLGVIGVAPPDREVLSTRPPRPTNGGNIDCKELTAGSTVFLPVHVPGALLCLGDGHAAQGDGEVGGTAIECEMTTLLTVSLPAHTPITSIHATTPTARITFGFDVDLNEAAAQALDAMLQWMCHDFHIDRQVALALAGVAVDMRITQVANVTWGVHAVLPIASLHRTRVDG